MKLSNTKLMVFGVVAIVLGLAAAALYTREPPPPVGRPLGNVSKMELRINGASVPLLRVTEKSEEIPAGATVHDVTIGSWDAIPIEVVLEMPDGTEGDDAMFTVFPSPEGRVKGSLYGNSMENIERTPRPDGGTTWRWTEKSEFREIPGEAIVRIWYAVHPSKMIEDGHSGDQQQMQPFAEAYINLIGDVNAAPEEG